MSQLQSFANSPIKVSSIIGTDVVNAKGDNLGDIKEVVIDPIPARSRMPSYRLAAFSAWERSCLQFRSARSNTT